MICQPAGILRAMKTSAMIKDFALILVIVLVSTLALQTFFQPGLFETHEGRLHVIKLHWYVEALDTVFH